MKEGSLVCNECKIKINCDLHLKPETARREPLEKRGTAISCRNFGCDLLLDNAEHEYLEVYKLKNWVDFPSTPFSVKGVECGARGKPKGCGLIVSDRGMIYSRDDETDLYFSNGQGIRLGR